tara:strand:+ start:950 stop:1624 length:675 start_codon:yes stop_codon:yes gene_type:complete
MGMDFASARQKMVDNQIRTTDVTSHSVLKAFLTVERQKFVPATMAAVAYIDDDLEIAAASDGRPARYIMEPSPLAKLMQLAEVKKTDLVLEVGCGTGYAAALLSLLADSVVALESDEALANAATDTLSENGYDNVAVVTGELAAGYPSAAPYDVIFVNGAVEEVPTALTDQLRDGGRLVVVVGTGGAAQAHIFTRTGDDVSGRPVFNASVRLLPGFERKPEFVF